MVCPVCKSLHLTEITQSLEVLKCAERISKKVKSIKGYRALKEKFISFLDTQHMDAIEARGFLAEFEIVLKNQSPSKREFFGEEKVRHEAIKMKERISGKRARAGEIRRPKQMCPVCYKFHFNSAEIPDECWTRAIKGDITISYEFNKFLQANDYGELNLQ